MNTLSEGHAWPDAAISAIAGRQRTMITREQPLALGVRPATISTALGRGRLHRLHHGVYSLVVAAARPAGAAEQAALLACGETAALSHQTAAHAHGLRVAAAPGLQVTVVDDRRRPGLCVHRTYR
jgi:predicted transcriptional regulator of viral defense system